MPIRYVSRDGVQVGVLYMTKKGVHLVGGGHLVKFFEKWGRVEDNEFIIHPVDEEGDQFIEFSKPLKSRREVEGIIERELTNHGYALSPRRF